MVLGGSLLRSHRPPNRKRCLGALLAPLQIQLTRARVGGRQNNLSLGRSHCFNRTAKCFCVAEDIAEEGSFLETVVCEKSITFLESSEILSPGKAI